MRPMVTAVAAEDPDIAAKMPQATTLTCNKRPGSRVTQGAMPRNMSSDSRVRNRISPIQTNSGSAISENGVVEPQVVVASTEPAGAVVNAIIANTETPTNDSATQSPEPSSRSRTKVSTSAIERMSMKAP